MAAKWVFLSWGSGLVLSGVFAFSGGATGAFFGNIFWQVLSIGITVGVVERIIAHERRVRERPIRRLALNQLIIILGNVHRLWREMLLAASAEHIDGEIFSLEAAQKISTLRLDIPARVVPPQNWRGAMASYFADIENSTKSFYDRGLQSYCSAEVVSALNDLMATNFLKSVKMTRWVRMKDGTFGWGSEKGGCETLQTVTKYRTILVREIETYLSEAADSPLAEQLERMRAAL